MEKLKNLIGKCKCGVYLMVDEHKNYYKTVEKYFKNNPLMEMDLEHIKPEVYERMKEFDTLIELRCYVNNPNGFQVVYHYDIEKAIDEASESIKEHKYGNRS